MSSHASHIAVSTVLYMILVGSLYLLGTTVKMGPIPLWFASAQILFEATISVIPGFLVGWLARDHGLKLGALVGALGVFLGGGVLLLVWGMPSFDELSLRIIVGLILALLTSSFTNAVGGLAGVALRNQLASS